jgi:hypothetical protein
MGDGALNSFSLLHCALHSGRENGGLCVVQVISQLLFTSLFLPFISFFFLSTKSALLRSFFVVVVFTASTTA